MPRVVMLVAAVAVLASPKAIAFKAPSSNFRVFSHKMDAFLPRYDWRSASSSVRSTICMASSTDRNRITSVRSKHLDIEDKPKKLSSRRKHSKKRVQLPEENVENKDDTVTAPSKVQPYRYISEMQKDELLTAEEEVILARQVQLGIEWTTARSKLAERLDRNPTCAEWAAHMSVDEDTLKVIMVRAEQAKITMVSANMRFAAHIANRYRYTGLSTSDLLQEASNGLMKAAERFDPDRGFKFSTYSIWWIRQSIFRAIAKHSRTIRLPGHAHELDHSIKRATRELTSEFGRAPTDEELSNHLNVSEHKISFYREVAQSAMSMEHTRKGGPGSDSDKPEATVSHIVSDAEPQPDECTQDSMLKDNVFELLETLNPREQEVMRLRFGLDDGNEHTLEEVGNAFCVTRERVRQIESRALQKLRQPYRNRKLRPFTVSTEEDVFAPSGRSYVEQVSHELSLVA